jgi:2-oxoisovalerate ferredoxin oxidoreductase beta subunit
MAELIAGLDGPVYVERVALYDNKQRHRAKLAIRKALRMQVERKGFAFVEVLSECPLHLRKTPAEAEAWVREEMTKVFPLGVKKDVSEHLDAVPLPAPPCFDPAHVLAQIEAESEPAPRAGAAFPSRLAPHDVALKLAGAGGDGAQTAALLLARAAINEGFDATHIPSYGPESRGGTSYADVHIADGEGGVLSPASPSPHVLVAFNAPSLMKFGPAVPAGGTVVYDSSVVAEVPPLAEGVTAVGVPFTAIATELGKPVIKNTVALGALQEATGIFPKATFITAIRQALREKAQWIALNETAFARGAEAARRAAASAG